MAHFKVENLNISFGGIRAVSDVSFEVEYNKIFSIIGPNGSGKTTIFNIISGIYKPHAGEVFWIMKTLSACVRTPLPAKVWRARSRTYSFSVTPLSWIT